MYRRIQPCAPLRPYVESFWIQEQLTPPYRCEQATRVLPAGKADLVFYYGDPFLRGGAVLPRAEIAGQRSRPIDVRASGRTGILIANLFPWSAPGFLPGSMAAFADRSTDLEDVLERASVRRLVARLVEAGTGDARVRLLEAFLLEHRKEGARDELVAAGAARLKGGAPLPEIAREQGLSSRQWRRRFEAEIGLPPKTFSRVMRFQRAAALRKSGRDWGDVCLACGYYDQSHLIKEFREFAGTTFDRFDPGGTPLARHFNRARPMSDFYNTIYLSSSESASDGRSAPRPSP